MFISPNLMKYLIIYWILVIQFHMNNSTHAIPQKYLDEIFCINKWKCVNYFFWNYYFLNVQKIELKTMCQKSISCISQNIKWNEKIYPKKIQYCTKTSCIFSPKGPPLIMCFRPIIKGNSIWCTKRTLSLGYITKLFAPWQEGCVELWDMIMKHFMVTFHSHQLHKTKQKGGNWSYNIEWNNHGFHWFYCTLIPYWRIL